MKSIIETEKYSVHYYWDEEIHCTVILGRRNAQQIAPGTELLLTQGGALINVGAFPGPVTLK